MYLLALVSASATALLSLPLWRRWCIRIGLVDDPGHRKIHDAPVPLAGGLAIVTALVLPLLGGWLFLSLGGSVAGAPVAVPDTADLDAAPSLVGPTFLLQHGFGHRSLELGGIIFGALGMLLLGLADDRYELRPHSKFAGQFLVALVVAVSGVRVTLFVPNPLFSFAITVLWILTVINAFNFTDNMNGLCSGLGAIGAWFFAGIAASEGQYLVALIAFLTFGSLLGFLPYNFPRARAFLGDSGSHLVGYLLAVLAILPHFYTRYHPHRLAVLIPLFVLGMPLIDMAWVVLLRWRMGKPFYQGDTNHLSHQLVRRGFSRAQAVLLLWLGAAVFGMIACFL